MKIERCQVAWAEQSTVGDTAQAQVGLFMWTGPLTGKNPIAFPNEQKIHGVKPHADHRL